jgi:hypothetical protein
VRLDSVGRGLGAPTYKGNNERHALGEHVPVHYDLPYSYARDKS